MSQLWSEEQIRQLIPDIDSQLDDTDVPTVVIKRDGSNIFLQFENRREIEFLIAQLSNLLIHQDELELGVTVKGNVTTFDEYCSE
ncbi:MAG TPA: hypothetical protein DCY91_10270 [Cyanobacteria bacterium UBA11370]|nr:hypothetical protein [Cyanobacteria bacterium UBA11370]HBY80025.1 hypothetical protein [Cyanobacteria bacterium UBA11148]